jgi:meiotically up-regulated gene 157 (Mug157) protein
MKYIRLEIICLMIFLSLILNIFSINRIFHCSSLLPSNEITHTITIISKTSPLSTIERSKKALEKLKILLNNVISSNDQPWIWSPTDQYPSVPYQPTSLLNQIIPKPITNIPLVPQSVKDEINRVCQRLKQANKIGGDIWCKLFEKCYADTLATTTTLLDDNSTYIITGDIDLMWLRDSSAQVHQYMTLSNDPLIQRIIEGLILRQTKFIFSNPYGSSFRLTLRPNPPSDDSLQSHHTAKGRNIHVAMHNYELDSLCYYLRLSYTWWNKTQRINIFNKQWLIAVTIIIQLMIIEQHHSEISPYRYTELTNNYQGSHVTYTGMIWSAFRPSDDQTKFGYLIPSNMMATVVLKQIYQMIKQLFPQQIQLLQQIDQLQADILSGIHTYGVINHEKYGQIYSYETNGFSQSLLLDDANVPSLLSASYFQFKTPYDPHDQLIKSTRQFILSKDNPLFYQGELINGIGSHHTSLEYIWPMSIIMEGLTNNSQENLDYVWKRLEISHAGTFTMHESFHVNNPREFTRKW